MKTRASTLKEFSEVKRIEKNKGEKNVKYTGMKSPLMTS